MKILIVIAASMFGFGLAVQETYRVPQQSEVVVRAASAEMLEQPAAHVLLDTIEITAVAPAAVALK
ncbi:hypothetical protein [Pontibacter akesuensis]|uniref:Uncharacterized protein n=1 Tax=Pontibacter akesuensis TaxID=388950 RepID=A0A1I7JX10_9BACT|nr:hypothetical protein [Pontibacter akesuensis]GHA76944.1 hypothetical protein GCM10007389_33700 [Pontibacter akesuensis]SFU89721.1 hypothetical protein SAMN04487941_3135 [Pontibacter akesuensis]